ncbi:helix-turn-helix domain-containing protein [Serratia liquefaciens]|uniref:helix-turn-helix domain-containing protein n=1 Tax=Serratia liquefaciens TaxID=614 RepID=UPI0021C7E0D6|nr:helix-turn-helix domain-containing protein [Serratia liquefaciens]
MKSEIELKKAGDSPFEIPEKILAIWGRSILGSGWTSIPNELLKNQAKLGMSNTELVLVIHLVSFIHNAEARVFPSIKLLSERMSQDRRTIQRTLGKLVEQDILRIKVRSTGKNDKGMTNIYDLTPLMLKLINLQIPTLKTPTEKHSCPVCGKTAISRDEIAKEFGFRTDANGRERTQSWCRQCRGRKHLDLP